MRPLRLLMTLDAVGGVWRYAVDLAAGLRPLGVETAFLGFGPRPSPQAREEALALGSLDWSDEPLDWLARDPAALAAVPGVVAQVGQARRADLLHLNLPSQAAHIDTELPIVVACHSCVTTWFRAVRGTALPESWSWQHDGTAAGLRRADAVVAPTVAMARAMTEVYPPFGPVRVVRNATTVPAQRTADGPTIMASGRWWDEAKGGATLDAAAEHAHWPVHLLGATQGPNGQVFVARHGVAEGSLDHATALARLRGAGIFAAPALYEPFGLAVAEAACLGLPLVLSDIPTFRELWDGAVFVPPRDAEALAQALNRLAASPAERARRGEAARARASSLTLKAQAQAMRELYDSVLARVIAPVRVTA
jgi:glycosyltransferase involved in cell wall biosynthesis